MEYWLRFSYIVIFIVIFVALLCFRSRTLAAFSGSSINSFFDYSSLHVPTKEAQSKSDDTVDGTGETSHLKLQHIYKFGSVDSYQKQQKNVNNWDSEQFLLARVDITELQNRQHIDSLLSPEFIARMNNLDTASLKAITNKHWWNSHSFDEKHELMQAESIVKSLKDMNVVSHDSSSLVLSKSFVAGKQRRRAFNKFEFGVSDRHSKNSDEIFNRNHFPHLSERNYFAHFDKKDIYPGQGEGFVNPEKAFDENGGMWMPNITDKKTIATFAMMASNAYYNANDNDWHPVEPWKTVSPLIFLDLFIRMEPLVIQVMGYKVISILMTKNLYL